MARKKEFNPDNALKQAMELFWLQGYEAASMVELCEAMDIRPGSLYTTFGSKKALFMKALELYTQHDQAAHSRLENMDSSLAAIELIFRTIVEEAVHDEHNRGCFMVNSIAELAAEDGDVAQLGADNYRNLQEMFYSFLVKAQQDGELSGKNDLHTLAQYLVNVLHGLRITAKVNQDEDELNNIVDATLSTLA